MPGNKAQFYAMKKRLQKAGKWYGDKAPSHRVPEHEEGEPPEKRSREEDEEEGDGAGGTDPEEGTSERARGIYICYMFFRSMSAFGASTGFSILVWCDQEEPYYASLEDDERKAYEKEMLSDAITLLGTRWGMDFTYHEDKGVLYAFGVCPRFTVGIPTINRALGTLAEKVKFHRGGGTDAAISLIRYKVCKEKYGVPDTVSEGSSGTEHLETPQGSFWSAKRKKL